VTGPDVPVNFSPANSKARFEPVTISSDRTIVKAMTDAKATAPNIAKLGCIGEFLHILTPIIKICQERSSQISETGISSKEN
jgi:hypothetical protein